MRDRQEVLEKFHELRRLKLDERKKLFLSKTPRNCVYNTCLRIKDNGKVGFCQSPLVLSALRTRVFVCNDSDTSKRCRVFLCRNNSEQVESDFSEILASPTRCGQEYPKLAILIWFLQEYELRTRAARFRRSVVAVLESLGRMIFFRWW